MGKKSFRSRKPKDYSKKKSNKVPTPKTEEEKKDHALWKTLNRLFDATSGNLFDKVERSQEATGFGNSAKYLAPELEELEVTAVMEKSIENGRITYREFPELMPRAFRDLKNQKIAIDQLCSGVISVFRHQHPFGKVHYSKFYPCAWTSVYFAWPTFGKKRDGKWHVFPQDEELKEKLTSTFIFHLINADVSSAHDGAKVWAECFDLACEQNEIEMDARFYENMDCFLEKCPLYKKSPFFWRLLLSRYDFGIWEEDFLAGLEEQHCLGMTLSSAAKGSMEGLEDVLDNCWECGAKVGYYEIMQCTRCKVASYCGAVCQAKAWEEGHQHTCKELRTRNKQLEKFLEMVDGIHFKRSPIYGIYTKPNIDYKVVADIAINMLYWDGKLHEANFPSRPSIKQFYENLAAAYAELPDTSITMENEYPDGFANVAFAFPIEGGINRFSEHALDLACAIESGEDDPVVAELRLRYSQDDLKYISIFRLEGFNPHLFPKTYRLPLPIQELAYRTAGPHVFTEKELARIRRVAKGRVIKSFQKIHKEPLHGYEDAAMKQQHREMIYKQIQDVNDHVVFLRQSMEEGSIRQIEDVELHELESETKQKLSQDMKSHIGFLRRIGVFDADF